MANIRCTLNALAMIVPSNTPNSFALQDGRQALIVLHDNSDATERMEQRCTTEDVLDWFRTVAFPEFNAIDEEFRSTKQKMWIRSQ